MGGPGGPWRKRVIGVEGTGYRVMVALSGELVCVISVPRCGLEGHEIAFYLAVGDFERLGGVAVWVTAVGVPAMGVLIPNKTRRETTLRNAISKSKDEELK